MNMRAQQLSPMSYHTWSTRPAPWLLMTGVPEAGGLDDGPLGHLLDPRGEFRVSASLSDPQGTAECSLQSAEQNCYSW